MGVYMLNCGQSEAADVLLARDMKECDSVNDKHGLCVASTKVYLGRVGDLLWAE